MAPLDPPQPELSRPVAWRASGKPRISLTVKASAEECAALARRLDLLAVHSLEASVVVRLLSGGERLQLSGRLRAAVRQSCVVTLAPVESTVDEEFTILYAPPDATAAELVMGPAGDDSWDEPWPGDVLDVGEAVAQQLALAIDPYPRAPGAELPAPAADAAAEPVRRPFAGLSPTVKGRRGRA